MELQIDRRRLSSLARGEFGPSKAVVGILTMGDEYPVANSYSPYLFACLETVGRSASPSKPHDHPSPAEAGSCEPTGVPAMADACSQARAPLIYWPAAFQMRR